MPAKQKLIPAKNEYWMRRKKTNPEFTKEVKYGSRKYTAIDAYYQIENLTEDFGPAGGEWYWDCHTEYKSPGEGMLPLVVVVRMQLYTPLGDRPVIQYGARIFINADCRVDEDAHKKAVMDALTKCASYLGVNADVFMGRFDDNKYVESLRREFAVKNEAKLAGPDYHRLIELIAEKNPSAKKADAYVEKALKALGVETLSDVPASVGKKWINRLVKDLAEKKGANDAVPEPSDSNGAPGTRPVSENDPERNDGSQFQPSDELGS